MTKSNAILSGKREGIDGKRLLTTKRAIFGDHYGRKKG
jgi:hypothetical protein